MEPLPLLPRHPDPLPHSRLLARQEADSQRAAAACLSQGTFCLSLQLSHILPNISPPVFAFFVNTKTDHQRSGSSTARTSRASTRATPTRPRSRTATTPTARPSTTTCRRPTAPACLRHRPCTIPTAVHPCTSHPLAGLRLPRTKARRIARRSSRGSLLILVAARGAIGRRRRAQLHVRKCEGGQRGIWTLCGYRNFIMAKAIAEKTTGPGGISVTSVHHCENTQPSQEERNTKSS